MEARGAALQDVTKGSVLRGNMKSAILIFASITLAATIFFGCSRKSADAPTQPSGVVAFLDAGVSIDVGEGWQRIDDNPGLPVCPPTLVGPFGMVRAMLFAPGIADMQAATNALRSRFDSDSDAVKDSYHQEGFTADGGLQGQHVSYIERTTKNGDATEISSHNFIAQRKDGRCVAISYLGSSGADSNTVQMIQKSLKLQ
jgi:hypothetical protein